MNEALRGYVTRVGFQITLTKPQMLYLAAAAVGGQASAHAITGLVESFMATGSALQRKGLIVNDAAGTTLTRAGQDVLSLIREAGLLDDLIAEQRRNGERAAHAAALLAAKLTPAADARPG